jgi:calcium/calmodulin-dependent protein kinase I
VAVKVKSKSEMLDSDKERFLLERDILREVNHPNIIQYYGFFEEDDKYFLVLQLAEGGTLADFIEKRNGEAIDE